MDKKPLVLVIEDERMIRDFVSLTLTLNNYQVLHAATGKGGLSMAQAYEPDAILLDLGLPDIDGMEVLRNLREQSNTPVIIDSARGKNQDKIAALDMGADDYIEKPFTYSELLARIRMVILSKLKRYDTGLKNVKQTIGKLEIDCGKEEVFFSGKKLSLSPIEYRILELLSKNTGKILTYNFIIREIWGANTDSGYALRVNMANIHRKIETNPAIPKYITAEVGIGYRMVGEI